MIAVAHYITSSLSKSGNSTPPFSMASSIIWYRDRLNPSIPSTGCGYRTILCPPGVYAPFWRKYSNGSSVVWNSVPSSVMKVVILGCSFSR